MAKIAAQEILGVGSAHRSPGHSYLSLASGTIRQDDGKIASSPGLHRLFPMISPAAGPVPRDHICSKSEIVQPTDSYRGRHALRLHQWDIPLHFT